MDGATAVTGKFSGQTRCVKLAKSFLSVCLWLLGWGCLPVVQAADYEVARQQLVREIESQVRATSEYLTRQSLDPRVMRALGKVPRQEFVPASQRRYAYYNQPLPIGYGQTISQPYIVAVMTDLLQLPADAKVLEIGTGSGYQAAVLAELAAHVYSIEIIKPLAQEAAERLRRLGYRNVSCKYGDGYYGWQQYAPFDAIIVTAAASHVPPPLIKQLKVGGRMVIPVGSAFLTQELLLVSKAAKDKITTRQILPVRFVPLTGGH
jgi:protein-L-isoaspartate(D-aspartate) O-methyltransferase